MANEMLSFLHATFTVFWLNIAFIAVHSDERCGQWASGFTDRSKAVLLLWFIFICYHIYNVYLLHDFVATLRQPALPSAL